MLAIVLALASAIGYGGSDFAAGLASRSAGVIQVTLLASAVSALVVAAALPFAASHPPSSGRPGLGRRGRPGRHRGALALYLGFRHAAFSVAGPLSAVGAAGFSVLAGLLLGERPTALALTGIVLALPAIVGAVRQRGLGQHCRQRGRRQRGRQPAASAASRPGTAAGRAGHRGGRGPGGGGLFRVAVHRAQPGRLGQRPVAGRRHAVAELAAALAVAAATRNLRLPGAGRGCSR